MEFGECDCSSHEKILVLKCTCNPFFVPTDMDLKAGCFGQNVLTVVFVFQDSLC